MWQHALAPSRANQFVPIVVQQHAEESAILCNVRTALVTAPHLKLTHLQRLDDRIAAHLDGLAVAGEHGKQVCDAALERPAVGEVFAAAVRAIEDKHPERLDKLFALVEAVPEAQHGLTSAFGWVSAQALQGTIKELLSSRSSFRQRVAIACCAMHRVDPAKALDSAIQDPNVVLRARALRAAGELARRDLVAACQQALNDEDPACRFRAAWSSVLLGDRRNAFDVLKTIAFSPGPCRDRALQVALKVMEPKDAHAFLQILAPDPKNTRVLIQGSGIVGDPLYVPWLIKQMMVPELGRVAGESFSFITGVDIAYDGLEGQRPENFESGPNDDPNSDNVAMDSDDNLPWPDQPKIQKWWDVNKHNFPNGVRFFMGKPASIENCERVLRDGYQRQRISAALYLSLLQPGTALFPTSAPAWRQQRWLAKMG